MATNHGTKGLPGALTRVYARKWSFLAAFLVVFFTSLSLLSSVGFVPEESETQKPVAQKPGTSITNQLPVEAPMRIEAKTIGLEAKVNNPNATDVASLDAALLTGAVRYPTSAKLGETGNTILFGHSSYLPIVHNQAYKAFNAIQDLEKGDRITVYGNGTAYVYAVDNVYEANAQEDAIPLTGTGHTLTLVTCDSFATKSDRYVVVATLVESYPLAN